ncbi:MAG: hypothetical protein HY602_02410, partial [Parcubacteria group bacterium]|nr:hypothetical protein [Parcubacteria group bacterium]
MRRYIFLLIAIALLLAQTLPTIINGRFTFAFDMGRDLLWVRNMVELKKPTLIGPWGSIGGVYFGPLWYYLLSVPYIIFNGDPRAAVAVPLAANLLTIIIGWSFLRRRKHPVAANVFALLYSVSPLVVSLSSFAFHANLLPLAALLFVIGLSNSQRQNQPITNNLFNYFSKLPLSFLSASLAYHLEPAAGVMLTGFLIIWTIGIVLKSSRGRRHVGRGDPDEIAASPAVSKKQLGPRNDVQKRIFFYSFILFILPFIPQIIFELRHNFIQTNSLISYFQGENTSLGGVLPLSQRLTERIFKISDTVSYTLLSNEVNLAKLIFTAIFLTACLTMGFFRRQGQPQNDASVHYSRFTIYFLLFHYLAYTFLFPAELKSWYLSGFSSLFILSISLIIEKIFTFRKLIAISIIAIFMLWNTEIFTKLIPKNISPAAPETLTAQLEVVDWIYQDALKSAEPFSIYTYTPPIYDYTYQYLIWWRGAKRYG